MEVLLCSESQLKTEAVQEFYSSEGIDVKITTFNCDELELPAQPIDSALTCAKRRFDYAREKTNRKYDIYIAIESGISSEYKSHYSEECGVIIDDGIMSHGSEFIPIPKEYNIMIYSSIIEPCTLELGSDITFGELLHGQDPTIDPKNWMLKICEYDRKDMIKDAIRGTVCGQRNYQKYLIDDVMKAYKSYPDFPKPGVLFQDIFAVLANPDAVDALRILLKLRYSLDTFVNFDLKDQNLQKRDSLSKVDYIVGLESRGFFGILLAQELKVGFIPIRKAGKLPGKVKQIEYGTEYSKDTCEISTDIPKGSRVIIFDDLIATGGSLKAAVTLLESLDCVVVDLCVLREVPELKEKARETLQRPYTVLCKA